MEVLHGVRPSQSPRPRVMQGLAARLNLKRSQGDHGLGIELRNGSNSEVPIQFEDEKATSSRWNGLATRTAVGDPMHVETSFVRNLGGLIRVRLGMPDRLMKAKAEDEHARG